MDNYDDVISNPKSQMEKADDSEQASIQLTNRGQVVGISSWSSMRQRRGRKSANHNPPFEWIITDTDQPLLSHDESRDEESFISTSSDDDGVPSRPAAGATDEKAETPTAEELPQEPDTVDDEADHPNNQTATKQVKVLNTQPLTSDHPMTYSLSPKIKIVLTSWKISFFLLRSIILLIFIIYD
ncbi:hypothetical protein SORBI_3008G009450 [Sorghum bicolor]|uniref:Uncharacterized protein n=1 Tax=Sorghum bicolor TaxID=4558 RepID=A0A1Z5R488_SORBI|nr:hypothetical protein SORBI_3008G009450 [Sorghum bicolor]